MPASRYALLCAQRRGISQGAWDLWTGMLIIYMAMVAFTYAARQMPALEWVVAGLFVLAGLPAWSLIKALEARALLDEKLAREAEDQP